MTDRRNGTGRRGDASSRAIIEASPIPFALNDDDGNIVYLNPEFIRTFGYTLESIPTLAAWWPQAYPDSVYRAQVAERWGERLAESRRTGAPFEPMDVLIRCADGSSRTVVAYAAALGEDMPGTHLVVLYDVTKERRHAEEQRDLQAQLVQAQRLESVGRLAGGIAHDFNNTLGVILGRAEVALKRARDDEELRAHLLEIRDAAKGSAELIRQLLAYAKRQPVMPQVTDLNEAVETSLRILRLLVGDSVRLRWIPANDVWVVEIDPGQFIQLLTNLCSNARDAVTPGGEVTIRTQNVSVADATTSAWGGAIAAGDYAVLSVADDGAGVAPEIADRIFEPFFTTKTVDDGQGHGLGLSTVYGIARQNGGGVLVESAPGGGALFKVLLRRHR